MFRQNLETIAQIQSIDQVGFRPFTCRTTADLFAEEQPLLMPIKAIFDGYVESMRRVTSLCLINIDRNRYSVPAQWVNQLVSVRVTTNKVRMIADGQLIAEHDRQFGRDHLICDPWHYLPVLEHCATVRHL